MFTDIRPEEIAINTPIDEIQRLYQLQLNHIHPARLTTTAYRIKKLKHLKAILFANREKIQSVLFKDFNKPSAEADMTETFILLNELNYTIRKLKSWLRPHRVGTPWFLVGASSYIQHEAKGHCLILAPWNFPIHLTLMPVIHAFAAGNVMLLKPSEFTPYTNVLVKDIIEQVFETRECAVVEGDATVSQYLTNLRFNHIFFTGSPAVGKLVMSAAAKHLCSVTLELGGKSPLIIDRAVDLDWAAITTAVSKFVNAGQYCISPDYAFVHEDVKEQFIEKVISEIKYRYGPDKEAQMSGDYARLINHRHTHRVQELIQDALDKGAQILYYTGKDEENDFIGPIILSGVQETMNICSEELFGPILYLKSFASMDEVIQYIGAREKPLSVYLFSKDKAIQCKVRDEVATGNLCINAVAINYYNHYLPFGGVNNSGIGKSHGYYSFAEFSNAKAILHQWSPWRGIQLLYPPFTKGTKILIDFLIKLYR